MIISSEFGQIRRDVAQCLSWLIIVLFVLFVLLKDRPW